MRFFWKKPAGQFQAYPFYPRGNVGIWADFPAVCTADQSTSLTPSPLPHLVQRTDLPQRAAWHKVVRDARKKIAQGYFHKVVLARQTTLLFDALINPHTILQSLLPLKAHPFMLQLDASLAFLGASPEKLFTRVGAKLQVEAVAGTLAGGESWSPKEEEELAWTCRHIDETVKPLCTRLRWSKMHEKPFGNLRHLTQHCRATLKTPQAPLLAALHPTPALGGYPSQAALSYLKSVEPFDRGFYGAPLGLFSEDADDVVVAIRSMLVRGREMHLFAGVGIVHGSCPDKEWKELDRKIHHVLQLFA